MPKISLPVVVVAALAALLAALLALTTLASAEVSSNPAPISIAGSGQATPYPATIDVSGLSGTVTDVEVTLHGVRHTWPDDVAVLLVGPGGQNVILMADVGGASDLNGVDLTFDDEAAGRLPDESQIRAGTYKPTRGTSPSSGHSMPADFPAPAPPGPYGTSLSALDGTDPNGTYNLYVLDDAPNDGGQISGGFSIDITTTASGPPAGVDQPPDLRMARLQDLQIQNTTDRRRLLRFSTIIVNVGAGSFELRGTRPSTDAAEMTVEQRVFDDAGGYRVRPTSATMYYAGDGHTHWHVKDLEEYKLVRLDNGVKVGTGVKHGFCFSDNTNFGSSQPASYIGCANNQPQALDVTVGLSRGWGDIYRSNIVDQYIDVTGLGSGRYRLWATADANNWFEESSDSNNYTWVDIQLKGNKMSVVGYGPAAQPIG